MNESRASSAAKLGSVSSIPTAHTPPKTGRGFRPVPRHSRPRPQARRDASTPPMGTSPRSVAAQRMGQVMRFPWEPNFIELMRDKETRLHTRSGLEPQTISVVATAPNVSATGERPSSPALFHCDNCDQAFLAYPRLLNHHCHDEGW